MVKKPLELEPDYKEFLRSQGLDFFQFLSPKRTGKLRKIGNTHVVTIPRNWLFYLEWKIGQQVNLTLDKDKKITLVNGEAKK